MEEVRQDSSWPTKLDSAGRIRIPADARRARGWEAGTELVFSEGADGTMRVLSLSQFISSVQQHFQEKYGSSRSMVDELLEQRSQEAAYDESGT